ncbi:cytochrome d ubiquinol oxidase subunit II [Vibrio europaeus]|uniref:Ubiquinol oxidase subunit II n=1 Tax=Vibrio europaeus TaxID=300876 RepID=A0A178J8A2_9VIBR|nr:cytochrome d ubiquinol oxidase subunit II [Vibrio europaeus]MDC5705122.1 cytochrome d ubiquinol oxidase subunit II [Vibrio europaeus]MDC5710401.1 cytochrome d ubiquinol oxidase subunit II [Vibrio europaeus]MDC5715491.1 cytochrome d ubiquinol oxidase subunit II [Vibrio europaeus]MDC5719652.1 cytochrome d ubiquinol oxidase subunit II [Vibrio europaeus]MDC5724460.1 cytochrome d ubiquinol oxidase subunit II [Vibrio europaeus]
MDIALIWYGLISFAVLIYVILDGFDLGIGILFPGAHSENERDLMMNSIAPVWDGNETWLVLGGGGLFAVFPLAYAVVMPALYAPLILMLLGLILRGVSFEYRFRTKRGKFLWDGAFFIGSLLATLMQGVMLGALLQGIDIEGRSFSGSWFDWLTPFSLFCAFALLSAYSLLGACWLIIKMPKDLTTRYYNIAKRCGLIMTTSIVAVSIWLPFLNELIFERWFSFPKTMMFLLIPICAAGFIWQLFASLMQHKGLKAYLFGIGLFVISGLGFGISTFPYLIPFSLTYYDAAAPDSSLNFLLAGAVFLVPMIIVYSAYAYWVFRGRLKHGEGYH